MDRLNCFVLLGSCVAAAGAAFSANPIFTDKWTADPAPLVDGDTMYLFTGHDDAREGEMFHMEDWLCFSTKDLKNWKEHGAILRTDYTLELRGEKGSAVCYWRRGFDGKKPHAFALYGAKQ